MSVPWLAVMTVLWSIVAISKGARPTQAQLERRQPKLGEATWDMLVFLWEIFMACAYAYCLAAAVSL